MSSEKKKKVVYTLEEDTWLRYLYKIETDRAIVENLLFRDPDSMMPMHTKSRLCEYYGLLYSMEEVIHKMSDEDNYDDTTKAFIVSESLAFQFSMFMQALVMAKEVLMDNNCSISLH